MLFSSKLKSYNLQAQAELREAKIPSHRCQFIPEANGIPLEWPKLIPAKANGMLALPPETPRPCSRNGKKVAGEAGSIGRSPGTEQQVLPCGRECSA